MQSFVLFFLCLQVLFQLCIILTGNYNFFNLLTIALCVSLLDDDCLTSRKRKKGFLLQPTEWATVSSLCDLIMASIVATDWSRAFTSSVFGKWFGRIVHAFLRLILFVGGVVGLGAICWHYFGLRVSGNHISSKTGIIILQYYVIVISWK